MFLCVRFLDCWFMKWFYSSSPMGLMFLWIFMCLGKFDRCFGWSSQFEIFSGAIEDRVWERKAWVEARWCTTFSSECGSVSHLIKNELTEMDSNWDMCICIMSLLFEI